MVEKLAVLIVASPNFRINCSIVTCLLHLVPCKRILADRLKAVLEQKIPLNGQIALEYIISKLEELVFLVLRELSNE